MNLYEMKLGESFWSSEMDSSILRVPGGWLFRGWDQERGVHTSTTFVPFNNEFIETSEQGESSATDRQQSKADSEDFTQILPFVDDAICLIENYKPHHALDILNQLKAKLLPC